MPLAGSLHTMDLFSRFFRENQGKFLAFAYSYTRSWAEAEDILMESMISLWECRDRWEEDKGLHSLLPLSRIKLSTTWNVNKHVYVLRKI